MAPNVVTRGAYLLDEAKKIKTIRGKRYSKRIHVFSAGNYVDEYGRSLKPYLFQENGRDYAWFKYDTPSRRYSAEFLAPIITTEDDPDEDPHVDYVVVPIIASRSAAKSKHYGEFLKKNAYPQTAQGLQYAPYDWSSSEEWAKNDLYGDLQPKLTLGSGGDTQWLDDNSGVTEQRSQYMGESPKVAGEPVVNQYDLNTSKEMHFVTRHPPIPQHIGAELSNPKYSTETSSRISYIKSLLEKAKEALEASVGHAKTHVVPVVVKGGKAAVTYGTPIVAETTKGAAQGAVEEGIKGAGRGVKQSVSSTEGPVTVANIATNVIVEGATGAAIGGVNRGADGFYKGVKKAQELRKKEKAKTQLNSSSPSVKKDDSQKSQEENDLNQTGEEESDNYDDDDDGEDDDKGDQFMADSRKSQKISAQLNQPDVVAVAPNPPASVSLADSYFEKTKANIAQQRLEQSQMSPGMNGPIPTNDQTQSTPQSDQEDTGAPTEESQQAPQGSPYAPTEESQQAPQGSPYAPTEESRQPPQGSPYEMWTGLKPWRGKRLGDQTDSFPDSFVQVPDISPEMFRIPPTGNKDFDDRVIDIRDDPTAFRNTSPGTNQKMGSEYDRFHNIDYPEMFSRHPRAYHKPHVARVGHNMMVVVIQPVGRRVMSISAEAKTGMNPPEESPDADEKDSEPNSPATEDMSGNPQRAYFKLHPVKYFDRDLCLAQGFDGDCLEEYRRQQRLIKDTIQ